MLPKCYTYPDQHDPSKMLKVFKMHKMLKILKDDAVITMDRKALSGSVRRMSTKEDILEILSDERKRYVSGSELAERCHVSGTAVWKAVKRLREEGYGIDAATNKGYRLVKDADFLSSAAIRNLLADEGYAFSISEPVRITTFDVVDSTNRVCRDRAAAGEPEIFAAVAANQTKGRGRCGRNFYSPSGSGIYLSILFRPSGVSGKEALKYTTMAAVAVCEAIEAVSGRHALIKWVNDIFIGGRKVCGILTEGSFDIESGNLEYVVVGIGINMTEPEGGFPEEIADTAGAVFRRSEDMCSRNLLAAEVIGRLVRMYREDQAESLIRDQRPGGHAPAYAEEYKRRCFVIGKDVDVISPGKAARKARAMGLDNDCRLYVRYEDGETDVLDSGEIRIKLKD